jgi:predicted nucleic acid-binding Zn finger protein
MQSVANPALEAQGTVELDDVLWKKAVNLSAAIAHYKITDPESQGHISRGMAIALNRAQFSHEEAGVWRVTGGTRPYHVDEKRCDCEDFVFKRAPNGRCKHRLAIWIARKAAKFAPADLDKTLEELVAEDEEQADKPPPLPPQTPMQEPPESNADDEQARKIPQQYVHWMHGKPHVLYVGLLDMAHERGLVRLEAGFIEVTAEGALAWARATFSDGRVFQDAADATRTNITNAVIAKHYPRMALTRAKARALRDALNIGLVSREEVE